MSKDNGMPFTGTRDDSRKRKELKTRLQLPASDYELKRREESARTPRAPLPRDKDGKPSYPVDQRALDDIAAGNRNDIVGPDIRVRSAHDKIARQFVRRGKSFADYAVDDLASLERLRDAILAGRITPEQYDSLLASMTRAEGVERATGPERAVFATPNPSSPFKRAGKSARKGSFVVEIKGKGR